MKRLLRSLVCLLSFAAAYPGAAQAVPEQQAKAAYVLAFINFTEWPKEAIGDSGQITLCLVGSDSISASLNEMNARKIGSRLLHVVAHADAGEDLSGCHAVYFGASVQGRFLPAIKALGRAPVLTISSIAGFAEKGGCIGLLHQGNKTQFEINLAAATEEQLRLPSQVLNLAARVFGK